MSILINNEDSKYTIYRCDTDVCAQRSTKWEKNMVFDLWFRLL